MSSVVQRDSDRAADNAEMADHIFLSGPGTDTMP